MKLKNKKTNCGFEYIEIRGRYIGGRFYSDGSGELFAKSPKRFLPNSDYGCESGTHKMRCEDIKRLAKFYTAAAKEIDELNKKLKKQKNK
jgi:hypothetical protein